MVSMLWLASASQAPVTVQVSTQDSPWTIVLALATVGALIVFSLQLAAMRGQTTALRGQLKEMHGQGESSRKAVMAQVDAIEKQTRAAQDQLTDARRKAEEDRHGAVTPLMWIEFSGGTLTGGSNVAQGYLVLRVLGNGVIFAPSLSFETTDPNEASTVKVEIPAGPYRPLREPDEERIPIKWRIPSQPVAGRILIDFTNILQRRFRWSQKVRILVATPTDPLGFVIFGAPVTEVIESTTLQPTRTPETDDAS
jgi:hypothetical protein